MSRYPLHHFEAAICDLADMAHLTADQVDSIRLSMTKLGKIDEEYFRLVIFCANQTEAMANRLKADFYAKFEEGRRGSS